MKTIIKQYQLINLIAMLILSVSFTACSSDDDNGPQTFLEKYNGSKWKYIEKDGGYTEVRYIQFQNKESEPFIQLYGDAGYNNPIECYRYDNLDGYTTVEVLDNSEITLTIRVTWSNPGAYGEYRFDEIGERIKLTTTWYEGEGLAIHTYYYDKTSDNLGDLEICEY